MLICILTFFFQAEDGIRDGRVTGVQTCALPISSPRPPPAARRPRKRGADRRTSRGSKTRAPAAPRCRSEERRVGKECRSRWTTYHDKKSVKDEYADVNTKQVCD